MKIYKIEQQQLLQASLPELWTFFTDPQNLAKLTPADLNFITTSEHTGKPIYAGQIITYTITPFLGLRLRWTTEITHVRENALFVDEQRQGPYKMWHHQHHFEEQQDGVLMTDIVHYSLPFAFLGTLAHKLFVRKQLEDIFEFRRKKTEKLFNNK